MADNLGREQLFHRILIFFAVYTAIIGIFNLAYSGEITLEDMGALGGGTIPGQISVDLPSSISGNPQTVSDIDFTTATDYSNLYQTKGYGTWSNSSNGLELTSIGYLNLIASVDPAVVFNNIVGVSDVYTVNYVIDNVPNQDFYIFPRYYIGDSVLARDTVRIRFSSDGVHLTKWNTLGYYEDYYFYPLSQAQDTLPGGSTITTIFKESISETGESNSNIQVYKDGSGLFWVDVWSITSSAFAPGYTHAGAGSDTEGFILKSLPSTTATVPTNTEGIGKTGIGFIDAIMSGISTAATLVSNFFGALGAVLGLQNNAIVPFWIWAIVGLPCIVTLAYIFVETVVEAVP